MRFFAAALIFFGAVSFGQTPEVPHKIEFAGMTLTIRHDARQEIQKDVDALTQSPRYFNMKVERARTYFPIIEKIFKEERLPDDFKFLVLQESALVSDAVSSSNAVGFWQFKDFTAEEMGMRVDREIDERMNLISSTRGAAQYLKKNNLYFNNWLLALQSYQMGAGGVMRSEGDKHNGARHMEITSDTYWYVKKYLAHKIAFEGALSGAGSLRLIPYETSKKTTLASIAKELEADESQLKEYNKWALKGDLPGDKKYTVIVPIGNADAGFTQLVLAKSEKANETSLEVSAEKLIASELQFINNVPAIRARDGETLVALADRSGIGLSAFLRYNEMSIDQVVVPGMLYFTGKKKNRAEESFHKVEDGESLWEISQAYGVKMRKLRKYNRLEANRVRENEMLWLSFSKPRDKPVEGHVVTLDTDETFDWPKPQRETSGNESGLSEKPNTDAVTNIQDADETSTDAALAPTYHDVKPTDTLYGVARQYGVTIKELMDWNDKKDIAISVGEKLRVTPR